MTGGGEIEYGDLDIRRFSRRNIDLVHGELEHDIGIGGEENQREILEEPGIGEAAISDSGFGGQLLGGGSQV